MLVERPAPSPCIASACRAAEVFISHTLVWGVILLQPALASAAAGIDIRIAEMDRVLLSAGAPDRAAKLAIAYREWKNESAIGDTCEKLSNATLHEAFRAGARVSRYRADDESLRDLECTYTELVHRGMADAGEHRWMYKSLVQNRKFSEANALSERQQLSLPVLPKIIGYRADLQGVLKPSSEGTVEWHKWIYNSGDEVIAYVSPSCAHSRVAMKSIAEDPDWAWIRPKIRFVVRRAPVWPYPGLIAWNMTHPGLPMQEQAGATGWGALDVSETPVFHLVRNGMVVKTLHGWANDGADLAGMKGKLKD